MALTFTSVLIALFIGGIEALQVIGRTTVFSGGLLSIANSIQLDGLGFYAVGIFVASWIFSMLWYNWRGYERLS